MCGIIGGGGTAGPVGGTGCWGWPVAPVAGGLTIVDVEVDVFDVRMLVIGVDVVNGVENVGSSLGFPN
jgi:hypothetical protein